MAYLILVDTETDKMRIIQRNVPLADANNIARRLNGLNELTAKKIGAAVKYVYKVMGK